MAPWVRSEYANELAVLSAWLAALLPWNVTYTTEVLGGNLLFVRFPFFQVRYDLGVGIGQAIRLDHPLSAARFQQGQSLALPYQVWAVGAGVLAVALALSVVFYAREEWVESWPVDPVRLMGAVLGVGTLVLAVATYYLFEQGFPAATVLGAPLKLPLGLVLLGVLAGLLLTVDRSDRDVAGAETELDADRT
jgi:hypothetical protein